jgi:hypothetical protein
MTTSETAALEQGDPPEHLPAIRMVRRIVAVAGAALERAGRPAEARMMMQCPLRVPGVPMCALRSFHGVDTVLRMDWGAIGQPPGHVLVTLLELVLVVQAAVVAMVADRTDPGRVEHLACLELRALQLHGEVELKTRGT